MTGHDTKEQPGKGSHICPGDEVIVSEKKDKRLPLFLKNRTAIIRWKMVAIYVDCQPRIAWLLFFCQPKIISQMTTVWREAHRALHFFFFLALKVDNWLPRESRHQRWGEGSSFTFTLKQNKKRDNLKPPPLKISLRTAKTPRNQIARFNLKRLMAKCSQNKKLCDFLKSTQRVSLGPLTSSTLNCVKASISAPFLSSSFIIRQPLSFNASFHLDEDTHKKLLESCAVRPPSLEIY